MIKRSEILEISKKSNVPPATIDKDYVLGHFLNGLFSFPWAQDNLLFKGGTCLRKCYFENYRFSEDIDLTVVNQVFELTPKEILEVCQKLKDVADIPTNLLKFEEVYHNDQKVGWDVEICYWGANHNPSETPVFRKDCHTKIILEIRHFELLLLETVQQPIIHSFSDQNTIQQIIPCYSIHEILAEKMRALLQRNRGEARDYFDLWYIKNNVDSIDWAVVKTAFAEKCAFKHIEFKGVDDFFRPERMKQVAITWEKRLSHQLSEEADRNLILSELQAFFNELFSNKR